MASLEKQQIALSNQQQQQQQQQVLKCPRCNSSNTKFCYYNNYSLSQPRHFCKACKRYWTRGGTLRNVPIGGGCRKINKRSIKTTFTKVDFHSPNPNPNLDHSTPSNNNLNNPLYGLLQLNPKYPRFNTRYDLVQPQMGSLGLGFSSSVSNYPSLFSGGFTSSCNSDQSMSSLLASSLQQPSILRFASYEDGVGSVVNEGEMEGPKSKIDNWNNSFSGDQNDNDQIKGLESSDPTSFLWNISGNGAEEWHDPTNNISVPSMI